MVPMQDTTTLRKKAYLASNTNTITITLNAIADERHVIDQVFWSTDAVPVANTSHITITNVTADNTVLCKWDMGNQFGATSITFKGGLAATVNAQVTVVMLADEAGVDNHMTVLYR
jgi:hypothetical protein